MSIEAQEDSAATTSGRRAALGPGQPPAIPHSWLEASAGAGVAALELSSWARRALRRAGAATVSDVPALRMEELASIHGVGPKTYLELDQLLEVLNRRFGPVVPGLTSVADEIVDAVLDAADLEILEGVGDGLFGLFGPFGRQAAENGELLRALLLDLMERYRERKRRETC